ncbi:MAG: AraC family transcriptional regulator, partial [Flavobacterium sp.]|nr:AraC family transcriptional regulator [Flavobacterium sp.]
MTYKNFETFNQYLGVEKPISDKIDFGIYHQEMPLKVKSDPIKVDFYRISLKENISIQSFNQEEIHNKTLLFFNSPDQNFDWDITGKWNGFYLQISKEIIEKHRFIFRNCLE